MYLLLNGKVILQNHSLDDPFETQTLQVTKPGMFIGVKSLDQGQSVLPLCFAVVYSDQAHLLKMSPEAANKIWLQATNLHQKIKSSILDKIELFSHLSEQTKNRIVYENSYFRTFTRGETLMEFDLKSPWCEAGAHLYQSFRPLINTQQAEEAAKDRKKTATQKLQSRAAEEDYSIYADLVKQISDKKPSLSQQTVAKAKFGPVLALVKGTADVMFKHRGEEVKVFQLISGNVIGLSHLL